MRALRRILLSLLTLLSLTVACGGGQTKSGTPAPRDVAAAPNGTPVQVAPVARATLDDIVSAPGETAALVEQSVRAPFAGTLTALSVVEGDRVTRGERIGSVVARDSEAALQGAEEMARVARSDRERADAQRALELARSHRIETPLVASAAGIVSKRSASAGDRVGEDQELVTVAVADSFVFRASVAQSDLARVRPGLRATIELAGSAKPVEGRVHGLLAGATASDLTTPMRIDLQPLPAHLTAGLFGTAHIVVAEHANVPVVPESAVLRDDVSGVARIATVGAGDKLHWIEVETGLQSDGRVEIVRPALETGERVVTSGQVGLDEGTALAIGK